MAAAPDMQRTVLPDFGPAVVLPAGNICQGQEDIQPGQGPGGLLQLRQMSRHLGTDGREELVFQEFSLLVGTQDLVFLLLQFLGNETLGIDQGLLPDKMFRDFIQLASGYLVVVAEDPVVAGLQVLDARRFPLLGFQ